MNFTDEEATINAASCRPTQSEYLVSAAKAGSHEAFAQLMEIYSQRILRQLLAITKNREDAEDALQDAALRAYRALPTFEERASFYSWITRIAINSALMLLRKRRRRSEISLDHPEEMHAIAASAEFKCPAPSPEQLCLGHQQRARVMRSIGKLHPRLREVIEMQFLQSSSVKEMAQALGISEAAVKSRLFRGRLRLASSRTSMSAKTRESMGGARARNGVHRNHTGLDGIRP